MGGLALVGLGGGLVAWGVVGGGVGVVSGLFGGQRYYAPVASYRWPSDTHICNSASIVLITIPTYPS